MKKNIYFLSLILLIAACSSESNPNHGKCRIETSYEITDKFGGDYEELSIQNIYDENGNEVEMNFFNNDALIWKQIFKYDENGNKVEENSISPSFNGLTYTKIYKYDENGNEVEENFYNADGNSESKTKIYKYDENGNEVECNYYSDGGYDGKIVYKYDENGNKVASNNYNADGSLEGKSIHKYDENGNEVEENFYNADGSLEGKNVYKYDENGNRVESNNYNADGSLESKYIHKHEYCNCDEVDGKKIQTSFSNQGNNTSGNNSSSSSSSGSSSNYTSNASEKQKEPEKTKCYKCEGTGKCRECGKPQRMQFRGKHGFEVRNEVRLGSVVCKECYGDGDQAFGTSDNYGVVDEPCYVGSCYNGWVQCEECSKSNPGMCQKCEGTGEK